MLGARRVFGFGVSRASMASSSLVNGDVSITTDPSDLQNVSKQPTKIAFWRMLAICSFGVAINFGWGVFFNLATPTFETLGVTPAWISFATASGPVCGMLQPFIGVWSDRCKSRLGRRRPFMIAGLCFGVAGMILFANSGPIGTLFQRGNGNQVAVVVAIISLWLFNTGLNMIQAVGMALILDMCTDDAEVRDKMTSYFSAASGLASVLANFIGFINFLSFLPFFSENYQPVFYLGILLLIAFTLPTILAGNEIPLTEMTQNPLAKKETFLSVIKDLGKTIISMNHVVIRIVILYFLSMAAQYPWQLFFTDYMGKDVYHGEPDAAKGSPLWNRYNEGVRMGSLAMGFMGVLTFIVSWPLPQICYFFGYKATYFVAHVWGVVSFLGPLWPLLNQPVSAITLCIIGGVFNAVTTAVPLTLLGAAVDLGLYVGILNVVQVVAQLIIGAVAGAIMQAAVGLNLGHIATGIGFGGLFAVIGLPVVFILVIPKATSTLSTDPEEPNRHNIYDETTPLVK